jgi:recombination protein RecR
MNYSSKWLESAVNELARLPGVGRKTAFRMALYLLGRDKSEVEAFSQAVLKMKLEIKRCVSCNNISDEDLCQICANVKRDHGIVCVVQDIRDVIAIENTGQFNGIYHVLGGLISPVDGVGPDDLAVQPLIEKAGTGALQEVIMALPATLEGDTTNYYIFKKLKDFRLLVTAIARGVAVGDDIEFTDEVTLGRSILDRVPYQGAR